MTHAGGILSRIALYLRFTRPFTLLPPLLGVISGAITAWGSAPNPHVLAGELTGMGPTYFWYQWDALREVTRGFGLDPEAVDVALRAMVTGAGATLLDSGLSPAAVIDLVPVKPLAGQEAAMTEVYRDVLPALHATIRSAPVPAR